jgi:hypothetical protein
MTDTLDGVLRPDARDDREAARVLAGRGLVAYRVVAPARPANPTAGDRREHRAFGRRRTRLRSAKVLDSANKFICECLVIDRSASGLRLTLGRNIGLPRYFRVHDDESGAIEAVATVWRRGATLGVHVTGALGPTALKPIERSALGGLYYAVPD